MMARPVCCCRPCLSRTIKAAIRRLEAGQPDFAQAILELLDSDIKAVARSPDRPCTAAIAKLLPELLPALVRQDRERAERRKRAGGA